MDTRLSPLSMLKYLYGVIYQSNVLINLRVPKFMQTSLFDNSIGFKFNQKPVRNAITICSSPAHALFLSSMRKGLQQPAYGRGFHPCSVRFPRKTMLTVVAEVKVSFIFFLYLY